MRIVVVSDTHGNARALRQAVLDQPQAEYIIHLGDGAQDVDDLRVEFPEKTFLQVQGNCDTGCAWPLQERLTVEGVCIFYTHGHKYNVKQNLIELKTEARLEGVQVALFGHTHVPMMEYAGGVYLMNPGSLEFHQVSAGKGSYGVLEISPSGIAPSIVRV